MKQRIIPVAIIVALIASFIIIGRKEFGHHDDVQTVQSESSTTNRKQTVSVPETTPVTEVKPAIGSKPVAGTKPVTSPKPETEVKSKTDTKTAETKPMEATPVAETKTNKPVVQTKPEEKFLPAAVPVLSPEEALLLVQKQEKEREEAKKRGWVFYEERFFSVKNVSSNSSIQQTVNWNYVAKDSDSEATGNAKKQDYFSIKSEKPIEYIFSEPLYEYTIYQYSLCCSVKGTGIVILSQKDGKDPKEYSIDSNVFETFVYTLGNGESFNTKIVPSISFQGDIQVESVTLQQKEVNNQRTVCLGTIEEISNVPDIEKSNYPDCYYTAKLVVKDILDGMPVPQNIQLLIPAFLDNKIDPLSTIMKKGNWKVSIRPFSLATKEEQEIEQVDEIESYLLTPYILNAANSDRIPELTVSGIPILEGESYVSPFDNPVNPPLPDKFAEDSKREIEKELAKVNAILKQADDDRINDRFQSAWNEKQKAYESLNSRTIWAKEQNSFFALPKNWEFIPSARITEGNLDAVTELDRLFKSNGIQLIIQIVPDYRDIAALVLNPEFQKYGDQRSARVAKLLLERGVEAQYISDELVKNAFNYERLFFYPGDFHPDAGGIDVMTSLIAKRLEKFGDLIPRDLDPNLFSRENRDTGFKDALKWPEGVDIGSHEAGSVVQAPYILYNKKILDSNPKSKILVFGNSFTQEPMTRNAYISYLAPKILHACTCRSMGGVSALTTLPQLFLADAEKFLKNKSIAVLPISITYLTDNRYALPNVAKADEMLKNASKSKFITSLPLKTNDSPLFPSSFDFSYKFLPDYLPLRTSCVALSESNPIIAFSIPDETNAKTVRISIQPLYFYGVSIFVNGKSCDLPSRYDPKWEILEFDIDNNQKTISIELDFDKCSSPDAKVLIGNISLFE